MARACELEGKRPMLGLKSRTESRWLEQVDRDLETVLVDHAHCEKKAAGVARSWI